MLTAYGWQTINFIGTCKPYFHRNNDTKPATFAVTDVQGPAMLGCATCQELSLVTINCCIEKETTKTETGGSEQGNTRPPREPQVYQPLTKDKVVSDYRDRFEGQGTFKMKPYHITLNPEAESIIHPPRAVPVHLRDMFKEELNSMVDLGVIKPISELTDWVNSIVLNETVNQRGEITKLRVCLDPQDLNKCVKREHYHTKTINEIICQLNGAKFFSIVDAKKGY